mmetsp:Transcript_6088/g.16502  ORF Transcript_6088/g.16502 Transcript_6088/m.16502 type:complete len:288 (-) Transcript_6088:1879-2742(-)
MSLVRSIRESTRNALVHALVHAAEDARGLAELLRGPVHHLAREEHLRGVAVGLEGRVHGVPVVKVSGVALLKLGQLRIDGLQQLREFLRQRNLAAHLVHGRGREVEELVEFVGRGHLRAEEAGKTIHGVIPAGLARLHLHAHAQRVEDGELVDDEKHHLGNDGHLEHLLVGGALPHGARLLVAHVVRLAVHLVEHVVLGARGGDRVVLAHVALVVGEHVLVLAVGNAPGREEEGDGGRVVEHLRLLVRVDGEEVVDEVEVVGEVVRPEAVLGVEARGHLLRVTRDEL